MKTTAARDGDHYIVNGQKTWTTLGQQANMIFCLVRTDKDVKQQAGISFLLIDMATPGIEVRPIVLLDGSAEVNEVFFTDVKVPVENLVGEENKGWTYAKYLLTHERTNIAGAGFSQAGLHAVKCIAKAEMSRGKPLIENPHFAARVAQVEIDLMAMATTNLRIISSAEAGTAPGEKSSMLKVKGTIIRQEINDLARREAGVYAMPFASEAMEGSNQALSDPLAAGPVAAQYFNNRKLSIFGGSNEIQREIIAKATLGRGQMNFDLTEERQMLQDTLRRFLRDRYDTATRNKIVESDAGMSRDVWAALAELGIIGVLFTEDQGGFGGRGFDLAVVFEVLGRAGVVEPFLDRAVLAAGLVADLGNTNQRAHIGSVITGEMQMAFAHGEPDSRYDLNRVRTTAVVHGENFVLNGRKAVVLNAEAADMLVISARENGASEDEDGISLFLMPVNTKGLRIDGYACWQAVGRRISHSKR